MECMIVYIEVVCKVTETNGGQFCRCQVVTSEFEIEVMDM